MQQCSSEMYSGTLSATRNVTDTRVKLRIDLGLDLKIKTTSDQRHIFLINNLYCLVAFVFSGNKKKFHTALWTKPGISVETAIEEALINALLMRKLTYIHFIINPADLKHPGFHEAGTRCHAATAPINLRAL